MKNGFRKLLATLCTLALLLTSFTVVFADNEIEQEQPEEQVELLTPEGQPEEPVAGEEPEVKETPQAEADSGQGEESEPVVESEQKAEPEGEVAETPAEPEAMDKPEEKDVSGTEEESGAEEEPKVVAEEELEVTKEDEDNQLSDSDLPSESENEEDEVVSESVQIETELNHTEEEKEEQPVDPKPDVIQEEIQEEIPVETPKDNVEEKPKEENIEEEEQMTEQTGEPEEYKQPEQHEESEQIKESEKTEESEEPETQDQTTEIEEQDKTEEQEEPETSAEQDQPEDFNEAEEPVSDLQILHLGKKGIEGALKAGEEYTVIYTSKYSYNIILTLTLQQQNSTDAPLPVSKNGKETGLKIVFDGHEKELTWAENEDPESSDVIYTFTAYAEKNQECEIRITARFDADFTLTATQMKKDKDRDAQESVAEEVVIEGHEESVEKEEIITEEEFTIEEEPVTEEQAKVEDQPTGNPVERIFNDSEIPEEDQKESMAEKQAIIKEQEAVQLSDSLINKPVEEEKKEEPDITGEIVVWDAVTELTEEELLAEGYFNIQVLRANGADVFNAMEENNEPISHLGFASKLWVKPTDNRAWALVYQANGNNVKQYIRWDDVLIIKKQTTETINYTEEQDDTALLDISEENAEQNEDKEKSDEHQMDGITYEKIIPAEEPLARSVMLVSTLDGVEYIEEGTEIIITATLEGFHDDDQYAITWLYSADDGETYHIIDGECGLEYHYLITVENAHNIWQIVISLE